MYQTIPSLFLQASSTSVASMSSYQQVGGGSEATGSALYVGRASFQVGGFRFVVAFQYDDSIQQGGIRKTLLSLFIHFDD